MYIPLQLRLTLVYGTLLGLALLIFGNVVYHQAEQRAYRDLDTALSSRAASVIIGKDFLVDQQGGIFPLKNSINGLGSGNIAIEVLDSHLRLLASTTYTIAPGMQTGVSGFESSPIPWDRQAAQWILAHPYNRDGNSNSLYTTISYQSQNVRVYTTINSAFGPDHVIQTARSEMDIEQSLNDLRLLLWNGGLLILVLALLGGWLLTRSVLTSVYRVTLTAKHISASRDFSKRVPEASRLGKNELTILAATFNSMLENLQQAYLRQQRFVADASHELRAPITSIRCNLDLLAKAPDLAPQEMQAALDDARGEANRMGRLVNDLLTLAHADNTLQQTRATGANGYTKSSGFTERVDLDSLLLEVYRQHRPNDDAISEDRKRNGPRIILHDTTPAQVYGDADKLKQALVALLDNAVKYTPYEGTVTLALTTDEHHALLRVSDTGIGIAAEDLPHIFDRFYRADRARSRDRGGSGLGLAIVKSIIEEHGGSIEVESVPGKGSVFLVRLPRLKV